MTDDARINFRRFRRNELIAPPRERFDSWRCHVRPLSLILGRTPQHKAVPLLQRRSNPSFILASTISHSSRRQTVTVLPSTLVVPSQVSVTAACFENPRAVWAGQPTDNLRSKLFGSRGVSVRVATVASQADCLPVLTNLFIQSRPLTSACQTTRRAPCGDSNQAGDAPPCVCQ
jgi:hypothetical protein